MREETVQPKKNKGRWHFWFLIVFSILLIVVFVFYLPLRFQSSMQGHEENPALMEEDDHTHEGDIEENHHLNLIDFLFPVALADEGHGEEEPHETVIADHPHGEGVPEDHAHQDVDQLKPLVSPVWWLLLIVSLVTTTILSLGIYKFIHVKK